MLYQEEVNVEFWEALEAYLISRIVEQVVSEPTITLPDGFNGHTVECCATPVLTEGNLEKLHVVGSGHLFRWYLRTKVR